MVVGVRALVGEMELVGEGRAVVKLTEQARWQEVTW